MKTEPVELMLSVKTVQITLVPIHCRWREAVSRESGEKGAGLVEAWKALIVLKLPWVSSCWWALWGLSYIFTWQSLALWFKEKSCQRERDRKRRRGGCKKKRLPQLGTWNGSVETRRDACKSETHAWASLPAHAGSEMKAPSPWHAGSGPARLGLGRTTRRRKMHLCPLVLSWWKGRRWEQWLVLRLYSWTLKGLETSWISWRKTRDSLMGDHLAQGTGQWKERGLRRQKNLN